MSGYRHALTAATLLAIAVTGWAQEKQESEAKQEAEPRQKAEPPQDADQAALVAGNTRFALELYDQLRKEDGNLFFSPFSLSTALAMTYAGARGDTAAEMARVLHFDLTPERLHPAFARLQRQLDVSEGEDAGYRLYVANALWPQEGYAFLPEFLTLCQTYYRAGLQAVDFVGATEKARQTINRWVEQRTEDKIKELLKPGVVTPLTMLVLTNAIYFKGDWAAQFDKAETRDAPFTLLDRKQVSVPLMNQSGEFRYAEDADIQVVELPYAGEALSMVVLLPRQADGLPALEKSLNARKLADWLSKLRPRTVRVALPRFKMTSDFQLNDVLQALGMRDAFTGAADFSGMTGSRELFIGAVIHQAFVDVNEEGTEAAAATAVVMLKGSLPPAFRADHPFLFLIRDMRSGSILFLGRVMNPTG
jgi:serpin B